MPVGPDKWRHDCYIRNSIKRNYPTTCRQNQVIKTPTRPFTIIEPQNPVIVECYTLQKCRATDFEASKLRKSRSGSSLEFHSANQNIVKDSEWVKNTSLLFIYLRQNDGPQIWQLCEDDSYYFGNILYFPPFFFSPLWNPAFRRMLLLLLRSARNYLLVNYVL